MQQRHQHRLTSTRLALALAAGCMVVSPASRAAVLLSGYVYTDPNTPAPLGPGNVDLPGTFLGLGLNGSFAATAGSTVNVAQFSLAYRGGPSTASLRGAGTLVTLNGDGNSTRLEVGNSGVASLTVSDGATFNGRANPDACLIGARSCATYIGNAVGSTGTFTVTDVGSTASLLNGFFVGGLGAVYPGFGTPGGVTRGSVNVLNGGVLSTESAQLAGVFTYEGSTGAEQSFANVLVQGVGSTWRVAGATPSGQGRSFNMAYGARSQADLTVKDGGQLNIDFSANGYSYIRAGNGGDARLNVSGAGSLLSLGNSSGLGSFDVADGGGTGVVTVQDGATLISSAGVGIIGVHGGNGSLLVTGPGSTATFNSDYGGVYIGGYGGVGRLDVSSGAQLSAHALSVGADKARRGVALLEGRGSRITLSAWDQPQLVVGTGEMTVSGGAWLNAVGNVVNCPSSIRCGALIGDVAGADAAFTVSGTGSRASFTDNFQIARQGSGDFGYGVAGADARASVNVLAGGRLETDRVTVGLGIYGAPTPAGTETSFSSLAIRGAGSVWAITGGRSAAQFDLIGDGTRGKAVAQLSISDGGRLDVGKQTGAASYLDVATNVGSATVDVSGAGSAVAMQSTGFNSLVIGSNGGVGAMSFSAGAELGGVNWMVVGSGNGGRGSLSLDGAGTVGTVTLDSYTAAGWRGGSGSIAITRGATLTTEADIHSVIFRIGQGNVSSAGVRGSGSLTVDGAGSLLRLATSATGPAVSNPYTSVGTLADGTANITSGGQMLVFGGLPSTSAAFRTTSLAIGTGGISVGSGIVNVVGANSLLSVSGTNGVMAVGINALGSGQLNIRDGAVVQTTAMKIGDMGGSGAVRIDNAHLTLSGEWQGAALPMGANLSVGSGAGSVGTLTLNHGARLLIENTGSSPTALQLGGKSDAIGGTGVLNVANGSRIDLVSASGQGQVFIGLSGTGVASFSSGSALNADYVGVGAAMGVDGGTGTLIVNQSIVTATTIEVGTQGYVGGTGTLVGNIVNRGVFSPGNSPGTLVIDGSFVNAAGGRLVLEVQDDGVGGFNTDHFIFTAASLVDLSGLQVSFRFLGNTSPNAFQASGLFDVDSFFRQRSSAGIDSDLSHGLFKAVSFSASADAYQVQNFSFSADGGAIFTATATAAAVPEPGKWVMLAAGLGVVSMVIRRRRPAD